MGLINERGGWRAAGGVRDELQLVGKLYLGVYASTEFLVGNQRRYLALSVLFSETNLIRFGPCFVRTFRAGHGRSQQAYESTDAGQEHQVCDAANER